MFAIALLNSKLNVDFFGSVMTNIELLISGSYVSSTESRARSLIKK
jgi:hypothetical protein